MLRNSSIKFSKCFENVNLKTIYGTSRFLSINAINLNKVDLFKRSFLVKCANSNSLSGGRSLSNFYHQSYSQDQGRQFWSQWNWNFSSIIKAGLFFAACFLTDILTRQKASASSITPNKNLFHGYEISLYMYHGCPFCGKVEAYLKYHNIPYKRVEVNALTKSELKEVKKRWNYKKVPAVVLKYEETDDMFLLKDSRRAISILESFRLSEDHSMDKLEYFLDLCYREYEREVAPEEPNGKVKVETGFDNIINVMYENSQTRPQKEEIEKNMFWREWIEDRFLHTIAPNLYRNYGDSIANTQHYIDISPRFGKTWTGSSIVYTGGPVMKIIGDKVKKRWNISEDPRTDLYNALNKWTDSLPKSDTNIPNFMSGGSEPSIADLEMFGLITILEGTRVMPDIEKNTKVMPWYRRMREVVSRNCGQDVEAKCFIAEHKVPAEAN